jgi:hypothetical protein
VLILGSHLHHPGWDGAPSGHSRCAKPSFTRDKFIAFRCLPDENGLKNPHLADGGGKFLQSVGIKMTTGLPRVRQHRIEFEKKQTFILDGTPFGLFRLGSRRSGFGRNFGGGKVSGKIKG